MKAIIFDFDGVILDTFSFHLKNIRSFFGIDLTEREFREMSNGNVFMSLPEPLKDVDWSAYATFVGDRISSLQMNSEIKNALGIFAVSRSLHIITSASGPVVDTYLTKSGVRELFGSVLGWEFDRSKVMKFNFIFRSCGVNASDCVFVTDTLGDIMEAKEAGVRTIAIDTGYHDRETLLKGNPHAIISCLDELFAILDPIDKVSVL